MKENQALEQPFLDRAKALTNVAEVFRCPQVTLLICEMVAFGVRAEAKIFEAAYGESGQRYWDAPNCRNRYEFTSSPICFRLTWHNKPNSWSWQGLRSFGLFAMRLRPASNGLLETPPHFRP